MKLQTDGFGYTLEHRAGALIVRQSGTLPSLDEMRRLQQAVTLATIRFKTLRIVFDNRKTRAPSPEVADTMRRWALHEGNFERVALLLDSENLAVRVNMEALAHKRPIRAFSDESDALAWLARK